MATEPKNYGPPPTFPSPTTVRNDGTAATDHAYLEVRVSGTGAGDPHVRWTIPSGTSWYAGPDNSASDTLKIGTGTAVGTNTLLSLTTAGVFNVGETSGASIGVNTVPFAAANATHIQFGSISASSPRTLQLYGNDVLAAEINATTIAFSTTHVLKLNTASSAANNAQTVTVGNVGPGGAGVSIQSWMVVQNSAGTTRYIPLFG